MDKLSKETNGGSPSVVDTFAVAAGAIVVCMRMEAEKGLAVFFFELLCYSCFAFSGCQGSGAALHLLNDGPRPPVLMKTTTKQEEAMECKSKESHQSARAKGHAQHNVSLLLQLT